MSEQEKLMLDRFLRLPRCPHCHIAMPNLEQKAVVDAPIPGRNIHCFQWGVYICASCGGAVIAKVLCEIRTGERSEILELHPKAQRAQDAIPDRAREYLNQAIESKHAPSGAILLCASAVDAMLKVRGLQKGSMYSRIDNAAESHLITREMAEWAHDVRLDANDQRHSDTSQPLPTVEDANRVIDFTLALAEILFVLPERVRRGREVVESRDIHSGSENNSMPNTE